MGLFSCRASPSSTAKFAGHASPQPEKHEIPQKTHLLKPFSTLANFNQDSQNNLSKTFSYFHSFIHDSSTN
jgi:hypothetical protein